MQCSVLCWLCLCYLVNALHETQKQYVPESHVGMTIIDLCAHTDNLPKVQYWSLKGRALNILPEHSQEAEESLSRAVKHDPTQIDTWNALGESFWKSGKTQQAHDCFAGSLAHVSWNEMRMYTVRLILGRTN